MSKKITDENLNEKQALDFEIAMNYLIKVSNKRAWLVAFISLIITLLLTVAIIVMLPLKRVDLAVVKVDKNGFVEIITNLDEQTITKDEALDKYFVARYIKTREQYFDGTLNQDYETTQMFSNKKVADDYIKFMIDDKNGRATILKDKTEIEVQILSIVLGDSNTTKTATIRVELNQRDVAGNRIIKSIKVITLTYDYLPLKLNTKYRLENPLGFIVNSYRVDEEIK